MTARLYRFLLRLIVPRPLREEFGEEMVVVFVRLVEAARERAGWFGVVRQWWIETRQLCAVAAEERRAGSERREARPPVRANFTANAPCDVLRHLVADVRLAARSVAKQPLYAAVVVAVLGAGIGLNTAVFSVAKATVAGRLPFREAESLVAVMGAMEYVDHWTYSGMTIPDLTDLRERNTTLEDVAIYSIWGNVTMTGQGQAKRVRTTFASPAYFRLLRTSAAIGRTFAEDDLVNPADGSPVVVLSHGFWRRQFGGDTTVVGTDIELTGRLHTIIGVMPASFRDATLPSVPEAWLPLQWGREVFGQDMFTTRLSSQFEGLARLKPGVTREQAEWELRAISKEIDAEVPRTPPRSARLLPMRQHFLGGIERPMMAIFAGSALVLIMCCVNVGALMLLRGRNRQRELAVRAAMGGGRARLAQLLLTETMVLVTAGAVVGIGLGHWGVELFRAAYGDRITSFAPMAMDIPALLASGVLMVVVGMACGLYPALRGSRLDPGVVLRNAAVGRGSRNRGRGRGRGELPLIVVVEAAVTIVLLIGAALTAQSLRRLVDTDLGYNATDLMTMRIDLTASRYADVAARGQFARLFIDRVQGSPGTEAVGLIGPSMLGSAAWHFYMTAPKDDPTRVENQAAVQWLSVTPGAIDAMGVTLLRGRDVSWNDRADAPGVALISSRVAERLWPGEDAIGKPYYLYGDPRRAGTVVGVVAEAKHRGRVGRSPMVGDAYIPFAQKPTLQVSVMLRTAAPLAEATMATLRESITAIDPGVPVFDVAPMIQRVRGEEAVLRMAVTLTSIYAVISALLAFIGTSGLLAYYARQRRPEMALRAALGAARQTIVGTVLRQGMAPVGVGVALGLGAAVGLSRLIERLLYRVEGTDPVTYAGVVGVFLVASLAACYLPARSAARVEPMEVLRGE